VCDVVMITILTFWHLNLSKRIVWMLAIKSLQVIVCHL